MRLLKKDDTSKAIVFLMVDSTDHVTGKTGLTPTITISKNGGAFASPSGTVSEIGNGWYKFTPAAADVDTLGPLIIHATASGADPLDMEYQVVAFDPYAAANLGLTYLDAAMSSRAPASTALSNEIWTNDKAALLDAAISTRSSHSPADVWTYANRTITGGTVDTVQDKDGYTLSSAGIDAIWDEPRSEHTIPGTFGAVSEWAGGGSGSVQVIVQPLTTTVQQVAGDGGMITGWRYAKLRASWWITDSNLTGHDLRVILYTDDGKVTKIQEYSTEAGEITITYQAPNTLIQLTGSDAKTPDAGRYRYVLRDQSTDAVLFSGICKIYDAPDAS